MGYSVGGIIEAADYNLFKDDLNNVYAVGNGDSGYGQTAISLVAQPIGKSVDSAEWDDLLTAAGVCETHQGTVANFPPNSEVAVDEVVEAHESSPPTNDPYDINSSIALLSTNRLNVDAGSVTNFANELNSTRNVVWSNQLQHVFRAQFTVVDNARYFFNSGGEVRIRGSRSGGSATAQNTSWTNLLTLLGTVSIGAHSTTTTGSFTSINSNFGYYELTNSFTTLLVLEAVDSYGGGYGANFVSIEGRSVDGPSGGNGDNGRTLEFRVIYNDGHGSPFFDEVDGTITSDIDILKATSPLSGIETPTTSTIVALTAGS